MAKTAEDMAESAKANAPWRDVTGRARSELYTILKTYSEGEVLGDIIIGHGVDYGAILELARAGRYAILRPTMDNYGPKLMRDLQYMLDKNQ